MGKPLSRPGCFRKSSCCLEKHGIGDGGMGGRDIGMEGGYGDGYVPQRSIYDTMCINQQIDSHHHHSGGSVRRDGGGEGNFSYSASGSLRVSRSDMFDPQPRSLTPNPSFVRRLDERAIYDSLKLGNEDVDGCHSPGHFNRSVSPSVSSFSAPGVSSSSSKKHYHHHHHHHHGESTKSRDSRHSWKAMASPKPLECMELTTAEMMDRGGGGYLNPGHYPAGGQSSSLTSPLISPFSGSPLSSGYHTPVFFSPAKPRPSQSQSLRCSPPHMIQSRHYSQTQSLRMSPPHELRRSPYRAPLVQLSAHDLEQDLRERGGGWGRNERDRDWERERERELERGWAQREWERERERGRLERERARERERRETSTFGTFGYGRPVPLHSDRDCVFLESDQGLDTTPLLLPQPSPSPSPSGAPRMGTGVVGRNRAGSKVGPDCISGGMIPKYESGSVSLVLVDSKSGCGPRLVSEIVTGNISEVEMKSGYQDRTEGWNKYDNGSRSSVKNMSEKRTGSQVKTRPPGRDLEGKVQSGIENKEGHRGETNNGDKPGAVAAKTEHITDILNTRDEAEKKVGLVDKVLVEPAVRPVMKPEHDARVKANSQQLVNNTEVEPEIKAKANSDAGSTAEPKAETKTESEVKVAPVSKPEPAPKAEVGREAAIESHSEASFFCEAQAKGETQVTSEARDIPEVAEQVEKKPAEANKTEPTKPAKSSRSKSKSSKSCSRSRPGTATGMRPGVLSPQQNKGLQDFESTGPPESMESTWPRRILVRKRTVRQGGAVHNLPILPPLPSVLSALEKRRPHSRLGSENPLTNITNSIVGRCSLKEPSHAEPGQGSGLVGRASLREQNLEHWRVCREQEEPRRSRSKEKQVEQGKEKEQRKEKEEKKEEKENVVVVVVEEINQEKAGKRIEEKAQETASKKKEEKKERDAEKTSENRMHGGIKIKERKQVQDLEKVVAKLHPEDVEVEEAEGRTVGVEGGVEGWDDVLDMVNTLWDDHWDKREAEGEEGGDIDSPSGSLKCWPLLRPPIGFGGSHPPSSAASELSLTELEKRARELDSDLEHLDLSQPHRESQDLYQTLLETQRDRTDIYQTHPGPQRDKTMLHTGVSSRSQVSLELSPVTSTVSDADGSPAEWSAKSVGTSTVGTSSTKEDSSPDSNLTLESDSSGVFLSLSNQSQEEGGSDSDPPISGSELGSSNTSLEKDGDDGALKEWGREESAELQWCYPSLLNATSCENMEGDGGREESGCGSMEVDVDENGPKEGGIGMITICKTPLEHTDAKGSLDVPQREGLPPRRKVTLMGIDSPLALSPSKQSIKRLLDPSQKTIRSSGLDCGDIDPFVQSDSFVYLAVSARPASRGETTSVTEVSTHDAKQVHVQQRADSIKTHVDQPNMERDTKLMHLTPQKPEEGDFLCTDSFVYLAAPACLLLDPTGTASYSGKESDSESSDSGPVDVSILGCGSVAGDSDWDSDLSDSDPSHSSRVSGAGNKSSGVARPKQLPVEPDWDAFGEAAEPEVLSELFTEQEQLDIGKSGDVTTSMVETPVDPTEIEPVTTAAKPAALLEQQSVTKKVTWQFKPAQRSVCTGSRKEKEKELARFTEMGVDAYRPSPSSSSSSSSSPSSSSSG